MKIEINTTDKYKIINVHEFDDNCECDRSELTNIIGSFGCFYPWYVSCHTNGISKLIYNLDGFLTESEGIKVYGKWDFKL